MDLMSASKTAFAKKQAAGRAQSASGSPGCGIARRAAARDDSPRRHFRAARLPHTYMFGPSGIERQSVQTVKVFDDVGLGPNKRADVSASPIYESVTTFLGSLDAARGAAVDLTAHDPPEYWKLFHFQTVGLAQPAF